MNLALPLVSVLIDTYNHERFIEQAVSSVLEQDFPTSDFEILVVDDGSADRTGELVRRFAPRVRYLRKQNGGQASAFNLGIAECCGEFVAFLDGDDWWAPGKLACVAQALSSHPEIGIVGHGIISVLRDGQEQPETLSEGFRFRADTLEGAKLFRRRGAFLGTSRMTLRSDLLRRIGPIPESIRIQADEYLFTLAAALMDAQILPQALTYYRLHDANNFVLASGEPARLRPKYESLKALAATLPPRLLSFGLRPEVVRAVVEYTQLIADQLGLILDGGWPWKTARTEWSLYRITHPEAPLSHRVFKIATLLAALVTSPRTFYKMQRTLAQNSTYLRFRRRWLPIPVMQHIRKGQAES